ncbi:MAG: CAP domain-containing protein [Vulcanimicrobiota bacterium]
MTYRTILTLALVGLLAGSASAQAERPGTSIPPALEALAAQVVELAVKARVDNGVSQTGRLDYLARAGRGHAQEMLDLNYFSHTSPTPGRERPKQRIELAGGWDLAMAENIYRSNGIPANEVAEAVVAAWLKSPTHRHNLLNPKYNRMDVGIALTGEDSYAIVQMFAFQAISIESLTATPSGSGYKITLKGKVVDGPSNKGAIAIGNSIGSKFEADSAGLFEVSFEAPADAMIAVGLQKPDGRYAIDLEFPASFAANR